jgi:hypothetical protein
MLAAVPASAKTGTTAKERSVTIALLPGGIGLAGIGEIGGLTPGLMSAGLGRVAAAQTYLDITQGNRVSESLYDTDLPLIRFSGRGVDRRDWETITERAASAPADVVPGLLASTLEVEGLAARAQRAAGLGRLLAADRAGFFEPYGPRSCPPAGCAGLRVLAADRTRLERLVRNVGAGELLIAIERPPPGFRTLTIAIAGAGFGSGLVTSDTTRTHGLVGANDVAPTILDWLGVPEPDEMNGEPIRAEGDADLDGLLDFAQRLEVTGLRRGPVVGQTLLWWSIATALAIIAFRERGARVAVPMMALSVAYLPLILLLTPALDPSLLVERLAAGLGAPALALATWRLAAGWRGFAIPALLTVVAYAADVMAGSVLVPLSIPGPNPAAGSRYFGIGNEIEATVAALLPLGLGAGLASAGPTRDGGRLAAGAFLVGGLAAAAAFALGPFGADVGAAIVLPAGAAVAAAVALSSRRGLLLAILVPLGCLVALMAADLLLGGGAHLTRSVLDAGGLNEAGDVLERRIRLAAASFTRGSNLPFIGLAVVLIALAIAYRRRLLSWFTERSAIAGFSGAAAATILGTVSNDSGATLLILGSAFVAAAAGFAWSLGHASSGPGGALR